MKSLPRPPQRTAWPWAALAIAAVPLASHAVWDTVPELGMAVETSDNILVDSVQERSASRSVFEAGVRFSNISERGQFIVEPSVSADAYTDSDDEQFETENRYLTLIGSRNWQTGSIGFASSMVEESVLSAEFASGIPDDPNAPTQIDIDTGRIDFANEKQRRNIHVGNVNFELSERTDLGFQIQRYDVAYTVQEGSVNRSNFDNTTFSMYLNRHPNERDDVTARVFVSEYTASFNDNATDAVGLEGTFSRDLSETWTFSLSAGVQRSEFEFETVTAGTPRRVVSADTDYLLGLRFRKRAERSTWNFDFTHTVDPNASGFMAVRDEAQIYFEQQVQPRLTARIGGVLFRSESVGSLTGFDDRDYIRFETNFEWAMRRTLFLTFGLDLKRQEFRSDNTNATSNSATVGIQYRGLSRQQGR